MQNFESSKTPTYQYFNHIGAPSKTTIIFNIYVYIQSRYDFCKKKTYNNI